MQSELFSYLLMMSALCLMNLEKQLVLSLPFPHEVVDSSRPLKSDSTPVVTLPKGELIRAEKLIESESIRVERKYVPDADKPPFDKDSKYSDKPFEVPSLREIAEILRKRDEERDKEGGASGESTGWGREPPKKKPSGWGPPPTKPPKPSGWGFKPIPRPRPQESGWDSPPRPTKPPGWGPPPTTQGWGPRPTTPGWGPPPTTRGWGPRPTTPGWGPQTTKGWGGWSHGTNSGSANEFRPIYRPAPPPLDPPTDRPGWSHGGHESGGRPNYGGSADRYWDQGGSTNNHIPRDRPKYDPHYPASNEEKYKPIKYPSNSLHEHDSGYRRPVSSIWTESNGQGWYSRPDPWSSSSSNYRPPAPKWRDPPPPLDKPSHGGWGNSDRGPPPPLERPSSSGWSNSDRGRPPPLDRPEHGGWSKPDPGPLPPIHGWGPEPRPRPTPPSRPSGWGKDSPPRPPRNPSWGWTDDAPVDSSPQTPFEYTPGRDDLSRYQSNSDIYEKPEYPPGYDKHSAFKFSSESAEGGGSFNSDDFPNRPNHYRIVPYTPSPEEIFKLLNGKPYKRKFPLPKDLDELYNTEFEGGGGSGSDEKDKFIGSATRLPPILRIRTKPTSSPKPTSSSKPTSSPKPRSSTRAATTTARVTTTLTTTMKPRPTRETQPSTTAEEEPPSSTTNRITSTQADVENIPEQEQTTLSKQRVSPKPTATPPVEDSPPPRLTTPPFEVTSAKVSSGPTTRKPIKPRPTFDENGFEYIPTRPIRPKPKEIQTGGGRDIYESLELKNDNFNGDEIPRRDFNNAAEVLDAFRVSESRFIRDKVPLWVQREVRGQIEGKDLSGRNIPFGAKLRPTTTTGDGSKRQGQGGRRGPKVVQAAAEQPLELEDRDSNPCPLGEYFSQRTGKCAKPRLVRI